MSEKKLWLTKVVEQGGQFLNAFTKQVARETPLKFGQVERPMTDAEKMYQKILKERANG